MSAGGIARGVAFYALVTMGAAAAVVLLSPSILLVFVHSVTVIKWKRAYINFVSRLFFDYTAFIVTAVCGTKILVNYFFFTAPQQ